METYTSQNDWITVGKDLSRKRESSAWELGDWINFGIQAYGKVEAYDRAEKIIRGRSRRSLYLYSHVARTFAAERRVSELSFIHHAMIAKYPPAIVDELLQEALESDWTCKRLRAEAEARCGIQKPNGRRKKVVITLAEKSIADLKELAPCKRVNWYVVDIIDDFLRSKGFEVPESLTTAEHREQWEAQGLCRSCGSKPVAEGQRTCEDCRTTVSSWRRWKDMEKESAPATPTEPLSEPSKDPEPEAARPTYSERREAQLAAGAKPIAPKRKCTCRIRVLWTECRPKEFIQDSEGRTTRFKETIKPTCFKTEEDAAAANEVFRACHGYSEQVVYCDPCRAWHLKHIYSVALITRCTAVEQAVVGQ